ncbi:hypothetical protein BH11PSE2_BH11PSE2_18820 [soil metagenome]
MRSLFKAALLAGVMCVSLGGQAMAGGPVFAKGYKPPMDSLGRPDLNGVWTNSTITPFERPASFGERTVMTREEVDAAEGRVKAANDLADKPTDPNAKVTDLPADCSAGRGKNCNYNSAWTDPGSVVMRVGGVARTSILQTPDGRVPANLKGQRMTRVIEGEETGLGTAQPGAGRGDPAGRNDNPEGRSMGERCIAMGSPVPRSGLYNNNYLIQQGRDTVAIWTEMIHEVRMVRLGASHRTDGIRQWGGDPIGWYEGPTLVVETNGYDPRQNFYNASDQLKVTERFTRVSPTRIHYAFTVEDPKTWAKPWGGDYEFASSPGIYEYACHEGNYGLQNILAGARAEEAEAKSKTASAGK